MSNLTGTTTTDRPAAPGAACLVPLSAPTLPDLIQTAAALRDLLGGGRASTCTPWPAT